MCEIKTVMRIGSKITVRIALWRGFHLDHASTEIGQQGRGVRTGNKGRALNNGNVLQGLDRHETFLQARRGSEVTARDQPFCADRYRSQDHRGCVSWLVRLHVPSLDGNVNAVALGIVKSDFSKRNAARAGSTAAGPGLFGAIADLLKIIYVEPEMV